MTEAPTVFDPQAQSLPNCPKAYVNGFAIGFSKTEFGVLFMINQEPVIQLLIPFPVALALADNLKIGVSHYEATTKLKIPDMGSIPSIVTPPKE